MSVATQLPAGRLTVPQLAADLGFTESTTYRLLARRLVPGASKIDPQSARSGWFIPGDAAERFRKGERGNGERG